MGNGMDGSLQTRVSEDVAWRRLLGVSYARRGRVYALLRFKYPLLDVDQIFELWRARDIAEFLEAGRIEVAAVQSPAGFDPRGTVRVHVCSRGVLVMRR